MSRGTATESKAERRGYSEEAGKGRVIIVNTKIYQARNSALYDKLLPISSDRAGTVLTALGEHFHVHVDISHAARAGDPVKKATKALDMLTGIAPDKMQTVIDSMTPEKRAMLKALLASA